jgi:hypothetical protein
MYFHPFKMFDDAANAFAVQEGRFGSSQSFGTGHSDQTMYPHSSVPFSLAVGPEDASQPPASSLTIVMPCTDLLGGHIRLNLILK